MPELRRLLLPALLLVPVMLGIAACSGNYSPNNYAAVAAQQANPVTRGVVIGVRQVTITPTGTIGAAAGGAAGGVAGSQAPGGVVGSAFGAIAGTLLGGLSGSATERAIDATKAWEYIVKQADGKLVSVTQSDKKPLAVDTHVLVIAGKQARVVRDYTVPLPAQPEKLKTEVVPPPTAVAVAPLPAPAGAHNPPASGTASETQSPTAAAPSTPDASAKPPTIVAAPSTPDATVTPSPTAKTPSSPDAPAAPSPTATTPPAPSSPATPAPAVRAPSTP
ncbi:MAG: hypothetical protein ACREFO_02220 [Acetobacteraceae bacterium]